MVMSQDSRILKNVTLEKTVIYFPARNARKTFWVPLNPKLVFKDTYIATTQKNAVDCFVDSSTKAFFSCVRSSMSSIPIVDGRNPAPPVVYETLKEMGHSP